MADIESLTARLAQHDNSRWTVPEMLKHVAENDAARAVGAVVVLRVDDGDGLFTIGFRLANTRFSEAVPMLECAKALMVKTLIGED